MNAAATLPAEKFYFTDSGNEYHEYIAQPYRVRILLVTSLHAARQVCDHNGVLYPPNIDTGAVGFATLNKSGPIVMGVFDRKRSTLVHECAHAALRVLARSGITTAIGHDESFAYLIDHMFESFENCITY